MSLAHFRFGQSAWKFRFRRFSAMLKLWLLPVIVFRFVFLFYSNASFTLQPVDTMARVENSVRSHLPEAHPLRGLQPACPPVRP